MLKDIAPNHSVCHAHFYDSDQGAIFDAIHDLELQELFTLKRDTPSGINLTTGISEGLCGHIAILQYSPDGHHLKLISVYLECISGLMAVNDSLQNLGVPFMERTEIFNFWDHYITGLKRQSHAHKH